MRLTRIFVDQHLPLDAEVALDERAAHHVARVLRMQVGAELHLFDGRGVEVRARLTRADKRQVCAHIEAALEGDRESPLHICLGQGISKGERMDFTLQKSVELGVQRIVPLWTQFSQVRLDEKRLGKRMAHWRGVIVSACEQCGRSRLPELLTPITVAQWLQSVPAQDVGLLLDPGQGNSLRGLDQPSGGVQVLIGPEGGLSEMERDQAMAAGFTGIALGPRILRTETAALTVLAALQTLWGDLG